MTNQQLQALHIFRQKMEKVTDGRFARPDFDLLLINIGRVRPDLDGAISSKALSNVGFERVMAFLESMLEKYDPKVGRRWRSNDDRKRAGLIGRRQEWEIFKLHAELLRGDGPKYTLAGLCHRQTKNRTLLVSELTIQEASGIVELLKAAVLRHPPQPQLTEGP